MAKKTSLVIERGPSKQDLIRARRRKDVSVLISIKENGDLGEKVPGAEERVFMAEVEVSGRRRFNFQFYSATYGAIVYVRNYFPELCHASQAFVLR